MRPAEHRKSQAPLVHRSVAFAGGGLVMLQLVPQAPQCVGSVCTSSHVPSGHCVKVGLHVKPHTPPVHEVCELVGPAVHTWPQLLQLWGSLVVSVHVVPKHRSGFPTGHPVTHPVPSHTGAPAVHVTPQPPQLGDWVVATHPASHARKPVGQPLPVSIVEPLSSMPPESGPAPSC